MTHAYQEIYLNKAQSVLGDAFDYAINHIIPQCPNLGIGIHLNIIEGESIGKDLNLLTDSQGNFNNSYIELLIKVVYNNL